MFKHYTKILCSIVFCILPPTNAQINKQYKPAKKEDLLKKLDQATTDDNVENKYHLYDQLSNIYKTEANTAKALFYAQKSLDYSRTIKNKKFECLALQNIALCNIGKNSSGINKSLNPIIVNRIHNYFNQSKTIANTINDTLLMVKLALNSADFEAVLKNYRQAFKLYNKGLTLAKTINDSNTVVIANLNIALTYYELKKYKQQQKYALQSLQYMSANFNKKARVYNGVGIAHYMLEDDKIALKNYTIAKKMANTETDNLALLDILFNLANYYSNAKTPNFEKSVEYHEQYATLLDSLNNVEENLLFIRLQEEYNVNEKEQKLKEANKNITYQKNRKKVAYAGLLLLSAWLLFLYISFRQKKKLTQSEQHLAAQKLENLINKKEGEIYDALIHGQDYERQRISADLHDGLGSILSTVKLYFGALEEKITDSYTKKKFKQTQKLLDNGVDELRRISKNMSSRTLNKFGLISAATELQKTINESGQLKINIYNIGFDKRLEQVVELNIYRILQELLSNIIKHAKATKVDINLTLNEDIFTMIIEDNGQGFNLLEAYEKGNGLRNIHHRLKNINGSIDYDTVVFKGTTAIVSVKINNYV